MADGNPGWIAHTITWNASNVYHQPILTNAVFAGIQFLIAFGIIYQRTSSRPSALSIVWSLGVWWFGEGLGAVFPGGATPFGGGPVGSSSTPSWPSCCGRVRDRTRPSWPPARSGSRRPRPSGRCWGLLALLSLVGSGRSPQALHDLVAGLNSGQPGWLAHIDRS